MKKVNAAIKSIFEIQYQVCNIEEMNYFGEELLLPNRTWYGYTVTVTSAIALVYSIRKKILELKFPLVIINGIIE